MTRQEAIEVLHHTIAFESGFAEAKRMAIEALEKEPSEDCISRVDLFEKMQSLCPETDKGCGDCHKACDIEDCLDFVMDAPSVIAEQSCDTCRHNKLEWFSEECDACTKANSNYEPTTEQSSMVREWIPCTKEGLPLIELGRKERQKWYGYKCSKCNFIYKGNALTESPFCQNCGAKMKV